MVVQRTIMTDDTAKANGSSDEQASLARCALEYARHWSVIPLHTPGTVGCSCGDDRCRSAGKHPRIRWETAMSQPASPEQVAAWWRRWPEANVGVVTGMVSGVAVVDVDPRHRGDSGLRGLETRWGLLPVTGEVRTGGGGTHLWFRIDHEISSGLLTEGVELKSEGGTVVVPPSLHMSGARYAWRPGTSPDELPLAPLPTWIRVPVPPEVSTEHPVVDARTPSERKEFADVWERVGIELLPGDRHYLCPFHDDHHPSLHIDAEGCRWYCFGCARGGGIGTLRRALGDPLPQGPFTRLRSKAKRGPPVTMHGTDEVEIVGESHHQDALLESTGGRRRYGGVAVETIARLVPEPDNPFDARAVAVEIDDRVVGHVAKGDLARIRPLVDDSLDLHGLATCRAVIRGGWDRGHGEVGWFGVTLQLPSADE